MSLFRTTTPFLQNNSWQNQALNALRYNTSQVGSVLPLIYGTVRQQVNLIALGDYMGPGGGKKGKGVGPLPLGGTNTVSAGKGGGGGKGGKGKGKKNQDYSVDVAFGICQGPVTYNPNNLVFANSSVESFSATGSGAGKGSSGNQLNFYIGTDGQAGDPTFDGLGSGVNYSGTCWITGTPMDVGQSPAIPNLSFEINGIAYNTGGPSFPVDANPANVITDFLTNLRYGASFPAANLDYLLAGSGTSFGDYCQAAGLLISVSLDGQQRAAQWLDGMVRLLNTAIVCSGELLKFIPYGDVALNNNGASWTPNLVPVYSLTDDDFLPWHPHQDGADPELGQDDPILVTRTNPADAFNWYGIEYTDRTNFYNSTVLAVFDQDAIDQYGLRLGDTLPGKCFASATAAQISAQLVLQRAQYIRNTPYKFQIGWNRALLEPMDLVLLTGTAGDADLVDEAVRVLSIEENDNGDLTIEAEKVQTGTAAPPANGLLYFEVTIDQLHGEFYNGPGEFEIGFGTLGFPLFSPLAGGDTDLGIQFKGLMAGQDTNSVGLYDAAFFGSGYLAFTFNNYGGFGIHYQAGHTYAFGVDTRNGGFIWHDVTTDPNSEWTGFPGNPNPDQVAILPQGSLPEYDITGFGGSAIYILMTGIYWWTEAFEPVWTGGSFIDPTPGPQQATLNTGATPFIGTVPSGWSAWDSSGQTGLVGGDGADISGVSVTWSEPVISGYPTPYHIASGARSTSSHFIG
jgi:hypothetical protein